MGESGLPLIGIYETICILFRSMQFVLGLEIRAKQKLWLWLEDEVFPTVSNIYSMLN